MAREARKQEELRRVVTLIEVELRVWGLKPSWFAAMKAERGRLTETRVGTLQRIAKEMIAREQARRRS